MRSRLGIAISIVKLDLIEGGPAGKHDQPLHDQIPLYFIAAPSTPARRPSAERLFSSRQGPTTVAHSTVARRPSAERLFLEREADQDRTAHINGMLATSHPFGVSQE
jgi:hypothetical protein